MFSEKKCSLVYMKEIHNHVTRSRDNFHMIPVTIVLRFTTTHFSPKTEKFSYFHACVEF